MFIPLVIGHLDNPIGPRVFTSSEIIRWVTLDRTLARVILTSGFKGLGSRALRRNARC
ncbi:hypothetical protein [Cyanobium sp. Morenito 9A2]|uniref:hypothetical protein n=1 Tax=Cyanobium sp. Morenito 9A2 TaxID=2823718 RepID=UPI0020CCB868|nr:hypothetical protein [Cyanobium sp. Morenito 9A2]